MIEKMTRYDFILPSGSKNKLMNTLVRLGVVDITRSTKPTDHRSEQLMAKIQSMRKLLSELEKGSDANLEELRSKQEALKREVDSLRIWGDYDRSKLESLGVKMAFYCTSEKEFKPSWAEEWALCEIAREKGKVYFVVLNPDGFPVQPLPEFTRTVSEAKEELAQVKAQADAYQASLKRRKDEIPGIKRMIAEKEAELDRYLASVSGESAAEDSLVVYEGFAPTSESKRLEKAFSSLPCLVVSAPATVEDNPPIKLKNNKFVKMFEVLTNMYGKPDYNEFDPTPFLSVFFLLFFAMCMGDAGYGLLLFIIGFLLAKTEGFKKLAPLVSVLGVATFIVGIVMHTFFGVDISTLSWIPLWLKKFMVTGTIAGFEAQMVLSLIIGIVHLSLAMIVKTVYATKNQGFFGSLGTWGWTVLIVGGVAAGTLAIFSLVPMDILKWVIIGIGVFSFLGIFLFNDIHRNPLKNVGSGLWTMYNNVTGLLGDVLSYLRLYALGLAGGMLGQAFNEIAMMTTGDGSFGPGWIACIIILIIGHALNLAMCCLGAFVHPLRLNFLEFFKNSGYNGKGRTYSPLKQ